MGGAARFDAEGRRSRSWAGINAAARVAARRSRFVYPFDRGNQALRHKPGERLLLLLGFALCVGIGSWFYMALLMPNRASAGATPRPALTVAQSLMLVGLLVACCSSALLLIRWVRPTRSARVLEATRIRHADRLAAELLADPDVSRRAGESVASLNKAASTHRAHLTINALWRGLIATSPFYVSTQIVSVSVVFFGQVAIALLSRGGGAFARTYFLWIFVVLVWVALFGVQWPVRRVRRMVRATLERRQCPDCGYDLQALTELPDPVSQALGPRACPECGVRWPLVPPRLVG